jgi:hypothetical protein
MASEVDFPLECDHIVIFAGVDAPEVKTLEALGLQGFDWLQRRALEPETRRLTSKDCANTEH